MNCPCTKTLYQINSLSNSDNFSNLEKGYSEAINLATSHYENFPVLSLFLPKKLRKHVAVVYKFSRDADDIADEGNDSAETRLKKLDEYRGKLMSCFEGNCFDNFWLALQNTVKEYNLSKKLFFDLLTAFEQDITKHTFENFDEILFYCKHSADPVGRIILEFFNIRDKKVLEYSDCVCTGLQLTNFYQDISRDIKISRIYIPLDEMSKFSVDKKKYLDGEENGEFKELIKFQIARNRELFEKGKNLIPHLPGRLKRQISWTIKGGETVLDKIEKIDYNVLQLRPKLKKIEYLKLMFRSL